MSLMAQTHRGRQCDVGKVSKQLSFSSWQAVIFGKIKIDVECTYVTDWMPDDYVMDVTFKNLDEGYMNTCYQIIVQ